MSNSNKLCYVEDIQIIEQKPQDHLRIMSYNVHGFKNGKNQDKFQQILDVIKKIDPDILVIQEVYVYKRGESRSQDQIAESLMSLGFPEIKFSKSGINAICSKFPSECEQIDLQVDPVRRLSRNALICKFPQYPDLILAGTHLDPFDESGKTRMRQIEHMYCELRVPENKDKQILIVGDFNSLRRADYESDEWAQTVMTGIKRGIYPIEDVVPWLESESQGFSDSFSQTNKRISVSVWSGRRVDYIMGSNVRFSDSNVLKTTVSDHYPIFADIQYQTQTTG